MGFPFPISPEQSKEAACASPKQALVPGIAASDHLCGFDYGSQPSWASVALFGREKRQWMICECLCLPASVRLRYDLVSEAFVPGSGLPVCSVLCGHRRRLSMDIKCILFAFNQGIPAPATTHHTHTQVSCSLWSLRTWNIQLLVLSSEPGLSTAAGGKGERLRRAPNPM